MKKEEKLLKKKSKKSPKVEYRVQHSVGHVFPRPLFKEALINS